MNLFFGLIAGSIVGSVVFIALLLLHLITNMIFSKTWHYYCLLVPLVFLLGGTHIAINLTDIMPPSASAIISQIPASHETPVGISLEFISPSVFDDLTANTHVHYGGVSLSDFLSVANRLMMYLESIVPFLLTIWMLGVVSFIAVSTKKYLQYRRVLLKNAENVSGLYCKIPIVVSVTAHTPMLIGVFNPIIVLPHMHFAEDELNMILAHEMVHYKRKDLLVKLVMLIANAVHWFNPAVYVLNRHLNTACELSCDEKLVSEMDTQNRIFYGETILQVLQYSTTRRNLTGNIAFATNLCNSKKNFKRRLASMMNTKRMKKSIAALALATGLLIVGGGFALSNMLNAAMPVYAGESAGGDNGLDFTALSSVPSVSIPQQSTATAEIQAESQENIPNSNQFLWPLDRYTRIASKFGMRANPVSGREEFHTGMDIPAPAGTPILAAKDGYVTFSGWSDGSGNMVVIYHGNGYSTVYAHNLRNLVGEGHFAIQGEHIADVGATGVATGPHLHFEIRIDGIQTDPLAFFGVELERQTALSDLSERVADANLRNTAPQELREQHIVYIVDHRERNIRFAMVHVYFDDYPDLQSHHIFFDTAANIAADAIYEEFDFCIDGMDGHMIFVDNQYTGMEFWSGFIRSEELTGHSEADELFHFMIDAVTGEVLWLSMNTPESPFR